MKRLTTLFSTLFIFILAPGQDFTKITNVPPATGDLPAFSAGWGDIDNDGYPDLFVGTGGGSGTNNSLYRNNGDGTFTRDDQSIASNDGGASWGNTFGDVDNDGDLDLYVANGYNQPNFFYLNNGDGTFDKITTCVITEAISSAMPCWADYDNDGLVDLYVTNCLLSPPYVEINNFYRNQPAGFEKITQGAIATEIKNSHGMVWVDYDDDGDVDLFIANQTGDSHDQFQNNGDGSFTQITTGPIVSSITNGGGFSFGDIDNDGDMDAFLTNTSSNNSLFLNNGDGTFTAVTSGDVVNDGAPSYCSGFADYDNDGDLDLFVANVQPSNPSGLINLIYENDGDGNFTQITTGILATDAGQGGGVAWADYDLDGDLDLFVARYNMTNALYQNDGNSNNWINIKLTGTTVNRSAIGARVKIKATINGNTVWQTREVMAQTGYESQSNLNVHFGLGDATIIEMLTISWPGGAFDEHMGIAVNQFIEIVEGFGVGMNTLEESPSLKMFPNPTRGELKLKINRPIPLDLNIRVFDRRGRVVLLQRCQTDEIRYQEISIDLSGIENGLYGLQVSGDDLLYFEKVIKVD